VQFYGKSEHRKDLVSTSANTPDANFMSPGQKSVISDSVATKKNSKPGDLTRKTTWGPGDSVKNGQNDLILAVFWRFFGQFSPGPRPWSPENGQI
jgi:hypothetical protein